MRKASAMSRAQTDAFGLCCAVCVCLAPGLGPLELAGILVGLVVAVCLVRLGRVDTTKVAVAAKRECAEDSRTPSPPPPEAWESALRVAGADFRRFASSDEEESEAEDGGDDMVAVSLAPPARPVHALSPAHDLGMTPRKPAVAASSGLRRVLNDLGLGGLEPVLTAWGAKVPADLKYMEDDDFEPLGLTRKQGRLLKRKAADAHEP